MVLDESLVASVTWVRMDWKRPAWDGIDGDSENIMDEPSSLPLMRKGSDRSDDGNDAAS